MRNNTMPQQRTTRLHTGLSLPVLALMSVVSMVDAMADDIFGGGPLSTSGVIYKQGLVLNETDGESTPTFAEYSSEDGSLVTLLTQFDASAASISIASADDFTASATGYRAYLDSLTLAQRNQFEVISVDDYLAADFVYPQGIEKTQPYSSSLSLLVYRPDALTETVQLDADNGVIVFQSRYHLDALETTNLGNARSVLLDNTTGEIVHSSTNNIGYRVAYIQPDGQASDERDALYTSGDELVAPVTNAWVSNGLSINGKSPTDEKGRYVSYYNIPPCPGFTYDYEIPIAAAVPYRSFNPQRAGSLNHYLFWSQSYYTCSGLPFYSPSPSLAQSQDYINALSVQALNSNRPTAANFAIDVTLLSGQFTLANTVGGETLPVTDETRYAIDIEVDSEYVLPDNPDFNGDDEIDHVSALGSIDNAITVTGDDTEAEQSVAPLYGVWFNVDDAASFDDQNRPLDSEGELIEPDLVRVASKEPSFDDIGLLEQISQEDLLNTDLYVYRESTGELVIEKSPFAVNQGNALNGVDTSTDTAFFELAIPGRDGRNAFSNQFRVQSSYEQWQASLGVTEAFQSDSDSLRVGEPIRVVAINRATGYLGSVRTSVSSTSGADLGIELEQLVLYPPNIKVRVERHYEVAQGLTQGEGRHYKVGSEGAALTSDQYVSIHTEWLDQDGGQLPTTLPGYTARLSTLVASNTLDSNVTHFSISPGKHIEVLKLNAGTMGVSAAHQYFHMVARPIDEPADFTIARDGPLQYRPEKSVPVRVAVYDEEASSLLKKAQDALDDQNTQQDSSVYQWVYRPEMAYSVYELDVNQINRTPENSDTPIDISDEEVPTIAATDAEVSINQVLTVSDFDALNYFGPESDLLYTLEGYEQQVTTDVTDISFSEFSHLGNLEDVDFLTFNLINNQDRGNVLWEWAFDYLYIDTPDDDSLNEFSEDTYYVFADNPIVDIVAGTIGYKTGTDGELRTVGLRWRVDGDGSLGQYRTREEGASGYVNTLTLDTVAGSKATVYAQIDGDSTTEVAFYDVLVLPGPAADLRVSQTGQVGLDGTSSMTLTAQVRDAFGNTVPDNTPVGFSTAGHGILSKRLAYTVNGVATSMLTGGFSMGNGQVLVDVNEETSVVDFTVEVPTLSVAGLPDSTTPESSHQLSLQVLGPDGLPASGVHISGTTSAGGLSYSEQQYTTDDQGRLELVWHTGNRGNRSALLSFRVGTEQLLEQTVSIVAAPGSNVLDGTTPDFSVSDALMVGDQDNDGTVPVQGVVPTTPTSFAFAISDTLVLRRTATDPRAAEQPQTLQLGSLEHPNRSPDFLLEGSELRRYGFIDDTGKIDIEAIGIQRTGDHPITGGHSYRFVRVEDSSDTEEEGDRLITTLEPTMSGQIGTLALKPEDTGGSIAQVGDIFRLSYESDNRLRLRVLGVADEEEQTVMVESGLISIDQWHEVAFQLGPFELTLSVNGERYTQNLPDRFQYAQDTEVLEFGDGYSGLLTAIRWYSSESAPLLVFSNNEEITEQVLQIDTDINLVVTSNNALSVSPGSRLRALQVPLMIQDESTSFIDVIASPELSRTAGVLLDTIEPQLDWPDYKALFYASGRTVGNALYRQVLSRQLNRSTEDYTELSAVTALLSVLQGLPGSNALGNALKSFLAFYGSNTDNTFIQAAAARYLYRHIEPMVRNEDIRLDNLSVPMSVLADMIAVSPLAAQRLAQTIKSESDFNTWMQYFSLPARGWVGVVPPVPSLNLDCDDATIPTTQIGSSQLQMPLLTCRATGLQAADLINLMWEESPDVEQHPHLLVETLDQLLTVYPLADIYLRQYVFPVRDQEVGFLNSLSPITTANAAAPVVIWSGRIAIRMAAWGGRAVAVYVVGKGIRSYAKELMGNFMLGNDSRIHPLAMFSAIAYLESRIDPEDGCDAALKCLEINNPSIEKAVVSLKKRWQRQLFTRYNVEEIDSDGNIQCRIDADAFGAAFELWVAANFHMRDEKLDMHEFKLRSMQETQRPNMRKFDIGIDYDENIDRFALENSDQLKENRYIRYSDIVIGEEVGKETIVELKSYRVAVGSLSKSQVNLPYYASDNDKKLKRKVPSWNPTKPGKTRMHRQIILDMILTREQLDEAEAKTQAEGQQSASKGPDATDFRWYFHDWKPRYDENGRLNTKVGLSFTNVEVRDGSSSYTGVEYAAARLSTLGYTNIGRKMVSYNLGLPERAYNKKTFPESLYTNIHGPESGGLKQRVKKFGLFTDISDDDINILLETVFGVDKRSDFAKIIKGEDVELLVTIEEHMSDVTDLVDEARDTLIDSVVDKETRKTVEAEIEGLEQRLVEARQELIDKAEELMPVESDAEQTCL